MAKTRFRLTVNNVNLLKEYLDKSLIVAHSKEFSPKVFKYWNIHVKAMWDGRFRVIPQACTETTAIVKYAGYQFYVTLHQLDPNRMFPSINISLM